MDELEKWVVIEWLDGHEHSRLTFPNTRAGAEEALRHLTAEDPEGSFRLLMVPDEVAKSFMIDFDHFTPSDDATVIQ